MSREGGWRERGIIYAHPRAPFFPPTSPVATHERSEPRLRRRLCATDPPADQSLDKHRLLPFMICRYDRLLPSSVSPSTGRSTDWSNFFVVSPPRLLSPVPRLFTVKLHSLARSLDELRFAMESRRNSTSFVLHARDNTWKRGLDETKKGPRRNKIISTGARSPEVVIQRVIGG